MEEKSLLQGSNSGPQNWYFGCPEGKGFSIQRRLGMLLFVARQTEEGIFNIGGMSCFIKNSFVDDCVLFDVQIISVFSANTNILFMYCFREIFQMVLINPAIP